jgi:hypothetical protein
MSRVIKVNCAMMYTSATGSLRPYRGPLASRLQRLQACNGESVQVIPGGRVLAWLTSGTVS